MFTTDDSRECHNSGHLLPSDIVLEIFEWWVASEYYSKTDEGLTTWWCSTAAKQLSHVCGFWRQLALMQPSLWARFGLHIPPVTTSSTARVAHLAAAVNSMLDIWLYRSKQVPLDFSVVYVQRKGRQFHIQSFAEVKEEVQLQASLLCRLVVTAARWRTAKITLRSHGQKGNSQCP